MTLKVAIVEDEKHTRELLIDYLRRYSEKSDVLFEVSEFEDGDKIVEEYPGDFDIVFLDIDMERLGGMETAERIREFDSEVVIIFITNMSDYAIKGYAVNALSFLLKPLPYFAFSQELAKAVDIVQSRKDTFLFIKTDSGKRKVYSRDILYIEVMKHTVTLHTEDESHSFRGTMKELEEELRDEPFGMANRCYLVNLAKVMGIRDDYVIVGEHELKMSRSRKKPFMKALAAFIGRFA